jgi:DNA-binding transcriptional ArsR family regulator
MKRLDAVLGDQSAFRSALADLERNVVARVSAAEAGLVPEPGASRAPAPARAAAGADASAAGGSGRVGLPASVGDLAKRRWQARSEEAAAAVKLAKRLPLDPATFAAVEAAAAAHKGKSDQWVFVMLSADQNAAVVRWLRANSKRPLAALSLWAELFRVIRTDTGEVMLSRAELAERVGTTPGDLSKLMGELESINAIRRERDGRGVRYFLSPLVATHLPSAALREQARTAAGPLKVVE